MPWVPQAWSNPIQISPQGTQTTDTVSFDIWGDIIFSDSIGSWADQTIPNTSSQVWVGINTPILWSESVTVIGMETPTPDLTFTVDGVPPVAGVSVLVDPLIQVWSITSPIIIESQTPVDSSILLTTDTPPMVDQTQSVSEILLPSTPITEVQASSTPPTESPLTSLMSSFEPQTQVSAPPGDITSLTPLSMSPTPPVTDPVVVAPPTTDALFSLIDSVPAVASPLPEVQKTEESPTVTEEVTSVATDAEENKSASILPEPGKTSPSVNQDVTKEEDGNHPMSSVGKELARMTRSPRLQGKLIGFISGLEELNKEEELLKAEKRKQIESYRIRIRELKAEYETRIHALELEEQNLQEQITTMDEEREHLTQVIDGFKQELEVV